MPTNVIFRAVKQHMLFVFHNVVIVIISTERTVPLVSVNVVKVNTNTTNKRPLTPKSMPPTGDEHEGEYY